MTPAYEFLDATPDFRGLAVAVGVGLLVGLERERRHGNDGIEHVAGIRTFALLAVVGVVSSWLGVVAQAMVLFAVASLAVIAYVRETSGDRGLTTEVAMLAITLLGMLSTPYPEWSAGLGVLVAVLLAAKTTMHRFSRQVLTAGEVRDGLILAAAVLVVLPLLPEKAFGPAELFDLRKLWLLLVALLAIGMLGHVCQRLLGARAGIPLAGFFAGFASSTSATASFGQSVNDGLIDHRTGVGSALLANLASLLMFIGMIGGLAPHLLVASLWPLAATAITLLLSAMALLWRREVATDAERAAVEVSSGAFRLGHAALLALAIFTITVIAGAMNHWFGSAGALSTAMIAALAEVHAAGASIAQLAAADSIGMDRATLGLVMVLAASFLAKGVVSALSGDRRYAWRFCTSLGLALVLAVASLFLPPLSF